ncbi:MAG: hypothetical protein RKE49_16150 [Oceanicaulis sp.]
MSDSDKPQDAEPVDAEFEPAPDGAEAPGEADSRPSGGAGGLKLALFVVISAAIGGAAGFALSRYLPPEAVPGGELSGLEQRLAALESEAGPDTSGLEERVSRIESVVQAREPLPGRVDALASAVADLEAAAGAAGGGASGDPAALDALRTRLDTAFTGVRERLEALEDSVETARADADAARSAAQQANAALSEISAGSGEDGAPSDARIAALSGRIDALDSALSELRGRIRPLEGLASRVDALASRIEATGSADDAASQAALQQIQRRVNRLAQDVAALSDQAGARAGAPAREPAGLAARALAFAALSEAASGDQPFAVELEALARVWPGAPGLDALRSVAREGAPTADRLEDTFPADALREATGETRTYFGVLRVARDDDAGPAAAIAAALSEDDLAEAARIVGELDGAGREALGDWRAGLAARLRVREALTAQSAALAAAGDRE